MNHKAILSVALAASLTLNFLMSAERIYGDEPDSGTSTSSRIELGSLSTGSTVSFTKATSDEWGIKIVDSDAPRIMQQQPVRIEVYRDVDEIRQLTA